MWYFDIKVLEIRESTVEKPEVLRADGDAPEQYPLCEEEDGAGCGATEERARTDKKTGENDVAAKMKRQKALEKNTGR